MTHLNANLAKTYKSGSQIARVTSEDWVAHNIACPCCGQKKLTQYPNNKPVADFSCEKCGADFELKAKKLPIGKKLAASAYGAMMKRLDDPSKPHLMIMGYEAETGFVKELFVIPRRFFVPGIIEKRKPLSPTARRAGWIGCYILLAMIPLSGCVHMVREGRPVPSARVAQDWQKTEFVGEQKDTENRAWLIDVMACIEGLGKKEFSLADVYACEDELKARHPDNNHIRDKIRQKLQVLRDNGYLEFLDKRGHYRRR